MHTLLNKNRSAVALCSKHDTHPQWGMRPPPGKRGDLLCSLEGQQSVCDVSVIHAGLGHLCAARRQQRQTAALPWPHGGTERRLPCTEDMVRGATVRAPHSGDLRPPGQAPDETHHGRVWPGHSAWQHHFHSRVIYHWCASRALDLLVPPLCIPGAGVGWVLCAGYWGLLFPRGLMSPRHSQGSTLEGPPVRHCCLCVRGSRLVVMRMSLGSARRL
jgi:hypothetical protein